MVQCRCCIVDFASHLTASTPLSRVYCRIPYQSTGRLCHNCCRIVDVASHMTAFTPLSHVYCRIPCQSTAHVDVASHMTASTSLSRVIDTFHAKVQTVCTIIAAGIPKSSDTFTLCSRHVDVFCGSTYSSSLLFQTNIAHYFTKSTQTCRYRRGMSSCFSMLFRPFLSVFHSFIISSRCSYFVYILLLWLLSCLMKSLYDIIVK